MLNMLTNSWKEILSDEFTKAYFINLEKTLAEEKKIYTIFPEENEIFNALNYTDYKDVKVVILGQDPYHGHGQAHGLSFSVKPGVKIPPSLKNIYKELGDDLDCFIPNNGYLTSWAKQGVLLINTGLTVRQGEANSHKKLGWTTFTNKIIEVLNESHEPIVFILWGKNAQSKEKYITNNHHLIIKSVHPSPLSAYGGFWGSKPFSKTNDFLKSIGKEPIKWQIDNL